MLIDAEISLVPGDCYVRKLTVWSRRPKKKEIILWWRYSGKASQDRDGFSLAFLFFDRQRGKTCTSIRIWREWGGAENTDV